MKLIPILLVSVLALTGCTSSPKVKFLTSEFRQSEELKTCAGKPTKPKGDYTQKDVAKYIKRYELAHQDCKEDLSALNKEIAGFNKVVKKRTNVAK